MEGGENHAHMLQAIPGGGITYHVVILIFLFFLLSFVHSVVPPLYQFKFAGSLNEIPALNDQDSTSPEDSSKKNSPDGSSREGRARWGATLLGLEVSCALSAFL